MRPMNDADRAVELRHQRQLYDWRRTALGAGGASSAQRGRASRSPTSTVTRCPLELPWTYRYMSAYPSLFVS